MHIIRASVAAAFLFAGLMQAARADDAQVKRGEYLARAGDCIACHTSPEGKPFAGGRYMPTPFGDISVPNITPDKATGIGNYTDEQFYRMMHEGLDNEAKYLYPVMPYPWYTQVTRDDALAIKAYLFSIPPENAPRKPTHMRFPFNIRDTLVTWRTLFFTAHDFQPKAGLSPKEQRGQYLVEGLGHCGECHNAHNVLGASQWSGDLKGGQIDGWYAPNLTSDGKQGIGQWSEDDLATYLKTGAAPGIGVVLGPMQETIYDSLRYLNDDDLHSIAAYLKSFPPAESKEAATPAAYTSAQPPGSAAYTTHCSACHRLDGGGVAGQVPALKGDGAVLAQGPENVVRVALGGLTASHGLAPMPAVGAAMTDEEVAQATDYVRNAWGNHAPATTGPGMVADLRQRTQTLLAGNMPNACKADSNPDIAKILTRDTEYKLRQVNTGDLIQTIDELLPQVKQAAPQMNGDELVNTLTAAYCGVALDDPSLTQAQRAERLGNFTSIVWGQLNQPGGGN